MIWVEIIKDYVGSIVEIISMILLLNLVSSSYWMNKWKVFAGSAISALCVVFFDQRDLPLLFLLNYIAIFVILTILTRRNAVAVFFEVLISSIVVWCIQYPLILIFYQVSTLRSLEFVGILIQLVILLVCCLSLGLNRQLKQIIRPFYGIYQREIYFITSTVFLLCMIELFLWRYDATEVYVNSKLILIFAILWFGLSLILLKNMIEKRKQRESIRLHVHYMEMTERLLDQLYKEKHDFNKHLQAIQGLCHCETSGKAVENIETYLTSLREKEKGKKDVNLPIHTGNGIINALLYTKSQEAKEKDIQLFYVPNGDFPAFPCEEYELVQMIGNLLDNAFEYVDSLAEEYHHVIIRIDEVDGKKRIEIRNPYFMDGKTQSSLNYTDFRNMKKGGRRGYGLTNVREIAAKCHGDFNLSYEDNEFVARILF